jgi:hypothetical protein
VSPDGRIVAAATDGFGGQRLLAFDACHRVSPVELMAVDDGNISAIAPLPDGRIAIGTSSRDSGGRVLIMGPIQRESSPFCICHIDDGIAALVIDKLSEDKARITVLHGNDAVSSWMIPAQR